MIIRGIKQLLKKIKTKLPDKRNFIFNFIKKNSVCCEIGVWKGEFSELILKKNNPTKLYLVDPWKDFGENYFDKKHVKYRQENQNQRYNLVNKKFKKNILKKQVEILKMTSQEAFSELENIKFDFIYVDGSHEYDDIIHDSENTFNCLNKNGIIIFDDFLWGENKPLNKTITSGLLKFITENNESLKIIYCNYQLMIQKIN